MPGLTHQQAMKLQYNHGTLGRLPAPGVEWEWTDVVDAAGTGAQDKINQSDAHAMKPLIESASDGRYRTTEWGAKLLKDRFGIEVGSEAGQARLSDVNPTPSGEKHPSRTHDRVSDEPASDQITLNGTATEVDGSESDEYDPIQMAQWGGKWARGPEPDQSLIDQWSESGELANE